MRTRPRRDRRHAEGRRPLRASVARLLACGVILSTAACHRAARVSQSTADVAQPPSSVARIPRTAARFDIDVVDDSTARFKPREAVWVREGMTAYAVDPANRDALVARLRITSVWNGTAVALVTSQVTRVTTEHVVMLAEPRAPWWKTPRFWMGVANCAGLIP